MRAVWIAVVGMIGLAGCATAPPPPPPEPEPDPNMISLIQYEEKTRELMEAMNVRAHYLVRTEGWDDPFGAERSG